MNLKKHKLALIIYLIILVVIAFIYKNYGIGADEDVQQPLIGIPAFNYYASLGSDQDIFHLYTIPGHGIYGPFVEVLIYSIQKLSNTYSYQLYHLILAIIMSFIYPVIYINLYLIFKKSFYSLVGMIMLLLYPRLFGNIFINSKDSPLVLFLALLMLFSTYFSHVKRIGTKSVIIYALISSLAFNHRSISLIFVLFTGILAFIKLERARRLFITSVFFIVFIIFVHITNPYLISKPLIGLVDIIKSSAHFPHDALQYFNGKYYSPANLPEEYLFLWIAITSPLIILAFSLVGIISNLSNILSHNLKNRKTFFCTHFLDFCCRFFYSIL